MLYPRICGDFPENKRNACGVNCGLWQFYRHWRPAPAVKPSTCPTERYPRNKGCAYDSWSSGNQGEATADEAIAPQMSAAFHGRSASISRFGLAIIVTGQPRLRHSGRIASRVEPARYRGARGRSCPSVPGRRASRCPCSCPAPRPPRRSTPCTTGSSTPS